MKHHYFPLACLLSVVLSTATAQIRGRVYQDGNANGRPDEVQGQGVARIRVRVYDRLGQLAGSTTTDTAGYYRLPLLPAQPLRLQFDQIPAGYQPTQGQFITRFVRETATVLNLGLYQPAMFVGDSARLAVSIQPLGDHTDPRSDSLHVTSIAFQSITQSDRREPGRVDPAKTGSIWGLAYDRSRHQLYSAAFAKRHSGFGPFGSGGIYRTDVTTGNTKPLVSFDDLGVRTGPAKLNRDLGKAYESRMNDSLMYAWVGKMGLGGLDLSDDSSTLYTVNLYDGKLYALRLPDSDQAPTSADLTGYALPNPNCQGGIFRPFAVKYYAGNVYVGGVCDASRSGRATDLHGYVYAFDPASKRVHEVADIPLNYPRGAIEYGIGNWFAWTDDVRQVMLAEPAWWAIHPQPILSDLEFDADGSLLIGLMDRLGHQMATGKGTPDGRWQQSVSIAAGDVLRASPKRKAYRLEANARVGERQSAGDDNGQGPAGGEFYYDDTFTMAGIPYHHENGMGGLALLPGSGQVLVSSREPVAEYN